MDDVEILAKIHGGKGWAFERAGARILCRKDGYTYTARTYAEAWRAVDAREQELGGGQRPAVIVLDGPHR